MKEFKGLILDLLFSISGLWRFQKLSPEKVFHVVLAPCFDKKLEAVREEFYSSLMETRDVDCVLTSSKRRRLEE